MAKRGLKNKRVIVTGASSGIGWHLVQQLSQSGAQVCATARREDRLVQLRNSIQSTGGTCEIVAGDITEPSTRRRLLKETISCFGGIDILINNAGIGAMGRFDEATPMRLREIFEVNFFATTELIREALPALKVGVQPIIVNISSVLGHRAVPLKSEYCASKFAIHGFSDAIRAELMGQVDLLLVSPSTTDSEFFDQAIEDNTRKDWKQRGAMAPEAVAQKTIRAIQRGNQEIILSHSGRMLVWIDRLVPALANRLMARFGN